MKTKIVATLSGVAVLGVPIVILYIGFLISQTGAGLEEGVQDVLKYEILALAVLVPTMMFFTIWVYSRFLRPVTQYLESHDKTREVALAALAASEGFPIRGLFASMIVPLIVVVVLLIISRFLIIPLEEFTNLILGGIGAGVIVALFLYYFLRIVVNPEISKILMDHPDIWKERDKWGFRINIRTLLLFSFISLAFVALMLAGIMDYSQARGALIKEMARLKFKDLQRSSLDLTSTLQGGWDRDLIKEYLSSIDVGQTGYVFILNENGEVVFGTLREKLNPQINQRILGIEGGQAEYPRVLISPFPESKEFFLATEPKGLRIVASSRLKGQGLVLAAVYPWEDYKYTISGMRRVSVLVILITLGFCAGIAYLVAHSVSRSMDSTLSFIKAISEGDLTEDIVVMPAHEVGDLIVGLKQMKENLRGMIGRVEVAESNVGLASESLLEASGTLHSGAQSQSSSVEGVSEFVDNVDSSLKTIAEDTSALARSATESSSSIFEMGATVEEVARSVEVLSSSVEEVDTSIEEMSSSVKQVAEHAESLREVAEETASAMSEMDASIKEVESIVRESSRVSEQVKGDAERGAESVDITLEGMSKIRVQVQEAHQVIDALGRRAKEIGKIVNVIDEVADETNLLSLNAAIIAAQAGEHGRGFAVVANEVSGLADRTASSTKEISSLIQAVQEEAGRAVKAMDMGTESVEEGFKITRGAQEALRKIGESVGVSVEMMGGIARAAAEQARGSRQVTEAMGRLAEMVGEIAKATGEQARGTELIMGASEKMREIAVQVKNTMREQSEGSRSITKSIEEIMEMVGKINRATAEQSEGMVEVVQAVGVIREVTRENLESTSEMEVAVGVLKSQAAALKEEVEKFQL
ncbi:MAG: hypothetical protein JSU92_11510 [Deltaproteobacteria bacterium]|nr:MAG: hypothetical protein JSU92_11510 [Deltaproteobacteria bacterium]